MRLTYPDASIVVLPGRRGHGEPVFGVRVGRHRVGQRDAIARPVRAFHAKLNEGDGQRHQEAPDQDVEDAGHVAER